MAAATIVAGLQNTQYKDVQNQAKAMKCQHNLRQLGMVLMTAGNLPNAAFYPKGDPRADPKSIVVLLKDKAPAQLFVCPTTPKGLQERGLTFLWNDKLNGKNLMMVRKTWVMVEMNCLAKDPVAPHKGNYHVLYSDASVKATDKPPKEILEALAELKKREPAMEEKRPEPAATGEPAAIRQLAKGTWVTVTQAGTRLYVNQEPADTLAKGQKAYVTDVKGTWAAVKVNIGGEWKSGWVNRKSLSE